MITICPLLYADYYVKIII